MQQTVDAVVETKDLTDAVVDLVTTHASGSSYFFYSVAETAGVQAVAFLPELSAYNVKPSPPCSTDLVSISMYSS